MLTERMRELLQRVHDMQQAVATEAKAVAQELERAKDVWPDYQVVGGVEWRDRSTVPDVTGWVWASDGTGVWLIRAEAGQPIGGSPEVVRFWTPALIPAPPARGQTVEAKALPDPRQK